MPRWSQHAEDSFRLPEGFKRIAYDADTMRYTFMDKHGKLYRSAPGEEYGTLTPVAFSASMDRPEAFSDGEKQSLKIESTSPAPRLMFSDFLPPSAMTSATSSLDQYAPAPPPSAYLTGAVRTALPKMQGVVQSIHRTITSRYTKKSANHASPPTPRVSPFILNPPPPQEDGSHPAPTPTPTPPPPREDEKVSPSNTISPVDASVDRSKSSASVPKD